MPIVRTHNFHCRRLGRVLLGFWNHVHDEATETAGILEEVRVKTNLRASEISKLRSQQAKSSGKASSRLEANHITETIIALAKEQA